jgi:hypothetical protein
MVAVDNDLQMLLSGVQEAWSELRSTGMKRQDASLLLALGVYFRANPDAGVRGQLLGISRAAAGQLPGSCWQQQMCGPWWAGGQVGHTGWATGGPHWVGQLELAGVFVTLAARRGNLS